eukprot:CAMPEP_0177774276 /NCGR_PEP_ID=MMETSP0491_2-20121128/13397_1 /TAXON_ID=63592 /ORGANISM="Tetraselmis chuii, Strain PLY429" /LENGTH=339 /DNA_ID=CAMNT_0019292597 /DNA_START=196 /DNA_END=1215 /DNA_ORIENTATION=-
MRPLGLPGPPLPRRVSVLLLLLLLNFLSYGPAPARASRASWVGDEAQQEVDGKEDSAGRAAATDRQVRKEAERAAPRHHPLPLPAGLVSFASKEGRDIFASAISGKGNMQPFFPLIQELITQQTESECGVATMLTILNALGVDPGRPWTPGVPDWDWYGSIEMLSGLEYYGLCPGGGTCCMPKDIVDLMGMCLNQWDCVARANSLQVDTHYWGNFTVDHFRQALHAMDNSTLIALNFDRRGLGQVGGGHFSPIAGYSEEHDMALVLDVARYKYAPFWAPVDAIFESMSIKYSVPFGSVRGFAVVRVNPGGPVKPQAEEDCVLKPPSGGSRSASSGQAAL